MQSHLLSGSLNSLNPQSLGGNITDITEKVIFIFKKKNTIHVSMGKTEKSPFRSSPFEIMKVIYCQGGIRMCAGSLQFIQGLRHPL